MNLAIVGAGGHAKIVQEAATASGLFKVVCFVDKDQDGKTLMGVPIVSELPEVEQFIVAIGDNRIRKEIYQKYLERGLKPATIVHPRAYIAESARIGQGTVVLAGAIVLAQASVGENCIINTAATIDHDCVIESHVHISVGAHLAGSCRVGEGSMLGVSSSMIDRRKVGAWATVGAGAVVVRDIESETTVVGIPAKPIIKGGAVVG